MHVHTDKQRPTDTEIRNSSLRVPGKQEVMCRVCQIKRILLRKRRSSCEIQKTS